MRALITRALLVSGAAVACAPPEPAPHEDGEGPDAVVRTAQVQMSRAGCTNSGFRFSVCWRGIPSISIVVPNSVPVRA